MGQQQLLLIVLGVIIVGIAVVVGINVFTSSAQSSNRDLVISQLTNLAAKAQQYYRKPDALGGGGNDFNGFALATADTGNAAGSFALSADTVTTAGAVSGSLTGISSSDQKIFIVGSGTEIGNDGTNPVKAIAMVTKTAIKTEVLN
jgi:Tfp pilus assembly protein PilE